MNKILSKSKLQSRIQIQEATRPFSLRYHLVKLLTLNGPVSQVTVGKGQGHCMPKT